ncbi:MAG: acetyltransferase [Bryobacteraceae bacterium]
MARLVNADAAVLDAQEPRHDLPCTATPTKPVLGFDLKFHAGYEAAIPLRELAGSENMLTILFRVTPDDHRDVPVSFSQHYRVPAIEEGANGAAHLPGDFEIGEGNYHVDWLMRDQAGRVCSHYWDLRASLPARDKEVSMAIAPGVVEGNGPESFQAEPPVQRAQGEASLNVKILINFAPQNYRSTTLQPRDLNGLISILRSLARDPRIGRFSIVAFNLEKERVIWRQDSAEQIDFPGLGKALGSLQLGTIDVKRLGRKHGDTEFLEDLIRREVLGARHVDALVFAGPKALLDQNVPEGALRQWGQVDYPVFYLNYTADPRKTPWHDAIGHVVKFFKGTEYTISRPRDLWFATNEVVSRVAESKQTKTAHAMSAR